METRWRKRGAPNEIVDQATAAPGEATRNRAIRTQRTPAALHSSPRQRPWNNCRVLRQFEDQIAKNIQEDQRIIVVDAGGFVLGLVVDHVHEVLNVPTNLVEPPPRITSSGGDGTLRGCAKLDDGARLIMLLDVGSLMKDQETAWTYRAPRRTHPKRGKSGRDTKDRFKRTGTERGSTGDAFMLGEEEYGVPISQIQEIDRLAKITKSSQGRRVHRRHHQPAAAK